MCGEKTVDKDRVIALATVSALTSQGEKQHPIVDAVIKGYIMTEAEGGQIELEKVKEATRKHEALNATKEETTPGKVNVIESAKAPRSPKTQAKANKSVGNTNNNNNKNKDQTKKPMRAIIEYKEHLTLDQLKCVKCSNSGDKCKDCHIKKDGCKYCGRATEIHRGECFWGQQDKVYNRVASKRSANALQAEEIEEEGPEEEDEEETIGGFAGAIRGYKEAPPMRDLIEIKEDEIPGLEDPKSEESEEEETEDSDEEEEDQDRSGGWWLEGGIIREVVNVEANTIDRAVESNKANKEEKKTVAEAEDCMNQVERRVTKKSELLNPLLYQETSNRLNCATQEVSVLCDTVCNIDCISIETVKKLKLKIKVNTKYRIKDAQDNDLDITKPSGRNSHYFPNCSVTESPAVEA